MLSENIFFQQLVKKNEPERAWVSNLTNVFYLVKESRFEPRSAMPKGAHRHVWSPGRDSGMLGLPGMPGQPQNIAIRHQLLTFQETCTHTHISITIHVCFMVSTEDVNSLKWRISLVHWWSPTTVPGTWHHQLNKYLWEKVRKKEREEGKNEWGNRREGMRKVLSRA